MAFRLYRRIYLAFVVVQTYSVLLASEGPKYLTKQFDAVLRVQAHEDLAATTLFARYWVSEEFYHIGVLWSEPHRSGLSFSTYPPGLIIHSDSEAMTILNQARGVSAKTYPKPFDSRGGFREMFGDYPIGNLRYAEKEAHEARIYLTPGQKIEKDGAISPRHRVSNQNHGYESDIHWDPESGTIAKTELLDLQSRPEKTTFYKYASDGPRTYLSHMTSVLRERKVKAVIPGDGALLKEKGVEQRIKAFDTPHHSGNRVCEVDFDLHAGAGGKMPLPSSIRVFNGSRTQLLRSAEILNVQEVQMTAQEAKLAAESYSILSEEFLRYRDLVARCWKSDPASLSDRDRALVNDLRDHFSRDESRSDRGLGKRLRVLSVLAELSRIDSDEDSLRRYSSDILTLLREHRLLDTFHIAGQHSVQTSILWGRIREANVLMEQWIRLTTQIEDYGLTTAYARELVRKGYYWTAFKLIEGVSEEAVFSAADRLQFEAIKSASLIALLRGFQRTETGRDTRVLLEWRWVERVVGPKDLLGLLRASQGSLTRIRGEMDDDLRDQIAGVLAEVERCLAKFSEADKTS